MKCKIINFLQFEEEKGKNVKKQSFRQSDLHMEYVAAIAPSEIMDTIDIKISSKDK